MPRRSLNAKARRSFTQADPSDVVAGGYDPDPYDQNPTNVDPNYVEAGERSGCTKQTPPGALTYGRYCYSSG